jgi:hypothetical protein
MHGPSEPQNMQRTRFQLTNVRTRGRNFDRVKLVSWRFVGAQIFLADQTATN